MSLLLVKTNERRLSCMTPIELAWAAGFFDGEGCVNIVKRKSNHRPTLQIAIGQSGSTEELQRFMNAVGGRGKIYGPYPVSQPQHKPPYKYRVHGEEAREVFRLISPYLCSIKKAKYGTVEPTCA